MCACLFVSLGIFQVVAMPERQVGAWPRPDCGRLCEEGEESLEVDPPSVHGYSLRERRGFQLLTVAAAVYPGIERIHAGVERELVQAPVVLKMPSARCAVMTLQPLGDDTPHCTTPCGLVWGNLVIEGASR
jgi:hypothetical protein